jgi:hypothetical protein
MSILKPFIVCGDLASSTPLEFRHMCGFSDLLVLVSNVITNLIILSTTAVVGVLIYHGLRLITSQGNKSVLDSAKKGLTNVVKGYIVILVAWVVVYTIVNVLVGPGYSLLTQP